MKPPIVFNVCVSSNSVPRNWQLDYVHKSFDYDGEACRAKTNF